MSMSPIPGKRLTAHPGSTLTLVAPLRLVAFMKAKLSYSGPTWGFWGIRQGRFELHETDVPPVRSTRASACRTRRERVIRDRPEARRAVTDNGGYGCYAPESAMA